MAIQSIPGELWWPNYTFGLGASVTTPSGYAMNSSGDRYAIVVKIAKAGTINTVHFATNTVTTGDDVKVSFMGVDSAGDPDDTITHSRVVTIGNGDDDLDIATGLITDDGTDLGNKKTVAAGDLLAIVFAFDAYVAGNLQLSYWGLTSVYGIPYFVSDTGSGWFTQAGRLPVLALEYDDGTFGYLPGCLGSRSTTVIAADTADTPDELCMKFKVTAPMRVSGLFWRGGPLDVDVELTLEDNTNVAGPINGTIQATDSNNNLSWAYLTTPVTIAIDTWYRLQWTPSHASNQAQTRIWDVGDAAMLAQFGLTSSNYAVGTRVDAGSWTDLTTRLWPAGLIVNGLDDGASGGGGGGRGSGPFHMGGALNSGQQRIF